MTQAALDANAVVSGLIGFADPGSPPGEVLRRWRRDEFTLVVSKPILTEIRRTLQKPFFTEHRSRQQAENTLEIIQQRALIAALTVSVTGVATHPEDDLVLATALSAAANVLVSGDRQLLKLGSYEGIRILSPRDFIMYLDQQPDAPTPTPQP